MKFLPWFVAAIALGVAAFLLVENREISRERDTLDRELDRARGAAAALEKAHAAEKAAAESLSAARVAAAAAVSAEKASRAAQKQAEAASKAAERIAADKDAADRLATARLRAERLAMETRLAAERARQANATNGMPSKDARAAAVDLEAEGRGPEAVRMYTQAARSGNCEAARRLGEIYDKGLIGITRDYAQSLKWYNAARVLGCEVPLPIR